MAAYGTAGTDSKWLFRVTPVLYCCSKVNPGGAGVSMAEGPWLQLIPFTAKCGGSSTFSPRQISKKSCVLIKSMIYYPRKGFVFLLCSIVCFRKDITIAFNKFL